MSVKQISLYYKDGSSDKVYHMQIEEATGGYKVNFQYGKRGATLKADSKTKEAETLDFCEKLFMKLAKEKMAKGYTEGESGAVFQSASLEERITGIVPQLLNEIEDADLEKYFNDDNWFMQEKQDGNRVLARQAGREYTAINRKGLSILVPQVVADMVSAVKKDIVVDGELIGDKHYLFDLLEYEGENLRSMQAQKRYEKLSQIKSLNACVVPAFFTEKEKREAFQKIKNSHGEGVVFKKKDSPYVPGRPASGGNQLKYKFWKSATVCVNSVHKTKRSVGVSVYQGASEVKVGNVTIPANYDIPEIGDIVEVIYLYCHVKGALYQTKYKGVRVDQDSSDCQYSQLKFKATPTEEDEE